MAFAAVASLPPTAAAVVPSALAIPNAQALCSLRDPQRAIYRLFPSANSYRSIVGTVGSQAREHVAERLPFTLHFNELGRHTLYVAYRDTEPLGFVHVRPEAGRWGLVEVAWALDLDLRLRGLEYQRCRDRAKKEIDNQQAETSLQGLDFESLRKLLDEGGQHLKPNALGLSSGARPLGSATVRNALKTIAVTESVWPAEVWRLRAEAMAIRVTHQRVAASFVPGALPSAASSSKGSGDGVQRSATGAWRCVDDMDTYLGSVIRTPWVAGEDHADVLWFVNASGRVDDVVVRSQDSSESVRAAFVAMSGWSEPNPNGCSLATELVATFAVQCASEVVRISRESASK